MKATATRKPPSKPDPKKTSLKPGPKSPGNKKNQGIVTSGQSALQFSYQSADDKELLNIIGLVRDGIPYKDFSGLVEETPFSLSEWAAYLQVSERTLQRNQKEKKSFQPAQSERIVELFMLYQYGTGVFGDKNNFDLWLNTRSVALGGIAPKELLDTKFGISMVKDALTRIEHGVLA